MIQLEQQDQIRRQTISDNVVEDQIESMNKYKKLELMEKIFQKPAQQRTPIEIEIAQYVLQDVKFFDTIKDTMSQELLEGLKQDLKFESLNQGEFVFQQGDKGKKFYIIIKGEAAILISKNKEIQKKTIVDNIDDSSDNNYLSLKVFEQDYKAQKFRNIRQGEISNQNLIQSYMSSVLKDQVNIGTLKTGDSFGEVALSSDDFRTASIFCTQNCSFLTLSKETFQQVLKKHYLNIQQNKLKFFKSIALLSNWEFQNMSQLYNLCVLESFQKGQYLFKIGDTCKKIFFIYEGEVAIIDKQQNKNDLHNLYVSVLSKGQIVGYNDKISSKSIQIYSAKIISNHAKFYVISIQEFLNLMISKKQEIKEFQDNGRLILDWRQKKVEQSQSSLNMIKQSHLQKQLTNMSDCYDNDHDETKSQSQVFKQQVLKLQTNHKNQQSQKEINLSNKRISNISEFNENVISSEIEIKILTQRKSEGNDIFLPKIKQKNLSMGSKLEFVSKILSQNNNKTNKIQSDNNFTSQIRKTFKFKPKIQRSFLDEDYNQHQQMEVSFDQNQFQINNQNKDQNKQQEHNKTITELMNQIYNKKHSELFYRELTFKTSKSEQCLKKLDDIQLFCMEEKRQIHEDSDQIIKRLRKISNFQIQKIQLPYNFKFIKKCQQKYLKQPKNLILK